MANHGRILTSEILSCAVISRSLLKSTRTRTHKRHIHIKADRKHAEFGFLFDIDGVIVRGKKLLPSATSAFDLLTNRHGRFRVPAIFVTNAGNTLRQKKAEQLSEWLGIKVETDQVVMSHSPLKMFQQFHDKHVLVSGQGAVEDIAKGLGFTHITTVDRLRQHFPSLDMVDHKRRKTAPCAFENFFPRIEAVILFGEPVRWETNLQLIIDVLLTNGKPSAAPAEICYPHLPILSCNMDLLWMAEACMPRFGHGCFLLCLEQLYHKITGRELKYTALIGKPSEITYHHADYLLWQQARKLGLNRINTIYCIGDNPETDIYGANLYDRYLKKRAHTLKLQKQAVKQKLVHSTGNSSELETEEEVDIEDLSNQDQGDTNYATSCQSILVCTGVYCSSRDYVTYDEKNSSNHNHRDFVIDPNLKQPKHVTQNVLEAVKLVFDREQFL